MIPLYHQREEKSCLHFFFFHSYRGDKWAGMFKSIRLEEGGNFKFWHRDWSVGNKQGGRREIQTRAPLPSTDLLKRKFLPPLLFLFFFKRVRPSVGRRALKGVNLSLMVTRSVPAVEKQQTSERLETRRDVFRR
jgi:hypothetical protein